MPFLQPLILPIRAVLSSLHIPIIKKLLLWQQKKQKSNFILAHSWRLSDKTLINKRMCRRFNSGFVSHWKFQKRRPKDSVNRYVMLRVSGEWTILLKCDFKYGLQIRMTFVSPEFLMISLRCVSNWYSFMKWILLDPGSGTRLELTYTCSDTYLLPVAVYCPLYLTIFFFFQSRKGYCV